jgi:Uri superfamily endonuclease
MRSDLFINIDIYPQMSAIKVEHVCRKNNNTTFIDRGYYLYIGFTNPSYLLLC